ncbi:MAG TPA: 23S rRNA (pseudouridine(1915)-N(3))-methyltransferase RlmH [Patescibacteria group bacterium]|jgi:23S rRNA (pseudouridine1915-N3)-methyltransferase|nr:23S rRNA (pseudouridine(1915)-N(3))-methyltransferase RlmH [Patescibacteria group bacterium]
MLKIKIICLGKLKEKAYVELEKEYLKRLSPFAKVKVVELPEVPYKSEDQVEKAKQKEAESIVKQLPRGGVVILLEEKGQERDSVGFAEFLERIGGLGEEIVFVLGSGVGLHESLKEHTNYVVSLSKLTFPHNFARILLEEQIYRSCTIISGKAYHK